MGGQGMHMPVQNMMGGQVFDSDITKVWQQNIDKQ